MNNGRRRIHTKTEEEYTTVPSNSTPFVINNSTFQLFYCKGLYIIYLENNDDYILYICFQIRNFSTIS